MRYLLLASAACLFVAQPAHAQDQDEAPPVLQYDEWSLRSRPVQETPVPVDVIDADTLTCLGAGEDADCDPTRIVVLGEGLPVTASEGIYAVTVIERDMASSSASGRLEDVLANVAGFQQFRRSDSRSANPSAQGATLRALGGNASSRALVLLDGVPMGDPFFGYIPFSAVDPSRLRRIVVTRGGGSGPFGGGALAGTIAMESAAADDLQPFNAFGLINTRGDSELAASGALQWDSGYAVVHGRWDRGDGFFTTPESQRVAATTRANYDSWSAGARVVQQVGEDVELQARVLAFEDHRTLRFVGADNSIEGQDLSLRLVTRGPWQVDALAYGQWRNFTNVVISSTTFNRTLDQRDTPAEGQGGKLELRPPVGDAHTLRLGADYRRSQGDLAEDAYNATTGALTQRRFAGGENTQLGFFVEDDWELGPLTLTGGLRADRFTIRDGYFRRENAAGAVTENNAYPNRADWEVSWRGGAEVEASEAISLRAAAYSGYRLPTLNELYRPFVVFPVTTQANAALLPERLVGWELGLEADPAPGVNMQVTWFDNKVKDAVANVTVATNLRERRNLDAIRAQGLEFTGVADLGALRFDMSLMLVDAEVVGSGLAAPLDGNRPAQTPDFAASATVAWDFMEQGTLSATLRHVSGQFEGDQEDDLLPSVTTLDLFGRLGLADELSLVLRVENLFDETVITRNQGGSLDLGAPRTVWFGLRWGY